MIMLFLRAYISEDPIIEGVMKYLATMLNTHTDSKERERTVANSMSVRLEIRANTKPLLLS